MKMIFDEESCADMNEIHWLLVSLIENEIHRVAIWHQPIDPDIDDKLDQKVILLIKKFNILDEFETDVTCSVVGGCKNRISNV